MYSNLILINIYFITKLKSNFIIFSGMNIPLRNITEILGIVLSEALKYHPNHIILLKLKGDLQYGNLNLVTEFL